MGSMAGCDVGSCSIDVSGDARQRRNYGNSVSGIVDAYDFAYGINPTRQPVSGHFSSNAAEPTRNVCSSELGKFRWCANTLSTATSITIGADSNIETYSTSVSKNQLNQI